jgi:hypothetical protein
MRLTLASCTPASWARVLWTKDWQAAQVIPLIGIVILSRVGEEAAASFAAVLLNRVLDIGSLLLLLVDARWKTIAV